MNTKINKKKWEELKEKGIRVFSLDEMGISSDEIKKSVLPTYSALTWDYYDVLNQKYQFLCDCFPDKLEDLLSLHSQYVEEKTFNGEHYQQYITLLCDEKLTKYKAFKPFRKRAIANFEIRKINGKWLCDRTIIEKFNQETDDIRALSRTFDQISSDLTESFFFNNLIDNTITWLNEINPDVKQIELVCHQVEIFASKDRSATNSPEGIHQDGADYIVSALVLERTGIEGGTSRIYLENADTPFFSYTLEEGEGIFQVDAKSPYYHDVSPITVEKGQNFGSRKIIGLDFKIVG